MSTCIYPICADLDVYKNTIDLQLAVIRAESGAYAMTCTGAPSHDVEIRRRHSNQTSGLK